ncbi:unnamed protein product [Sphenostylis stenocarpa]|uniref:Uncharacterized protein n=1 Tax=Sphenostylis stenocarpa TaxID=92480 RepID=A0AA86SRV0_9FABA|nr:unnamed protein product [Sphenostylis stenocarpa]
MLHATQIREINHYMIYISEISQYFHHGWAPQKYTEQCKKRNKYRTQSDATLLQPLSNKDVRKREKKKLPETEHREYESELSPVHDFVSVFASIEDAPSLFSLQKRWAENLGNAETSDTSKLKTRFVGELERYISKLQSGFALKHYGSLILLSRSFTVILC